MHGPTNIKFVFLCVSVCVCMCVHSCAQYKGFFSRLFSGTSNGLRLCAFFMGYRNLALCNTVLRLHNETSTVKQMVHKILVCLGPFSPSFSWFSSKNGICRNVCDSWVQHEGGSLASDRPRCHRQRLVFCKTVKEKRSVSPPLLVAKCETGTDASSNYGRK